MGWSRQPGDYGPAPYAAPWAEAEPTNEVAREAMQNEIQALEQRVGFLRRELDALNDDAQESEDAARDRD